MAMAASFAIFLFCTACFSVQASFVYHGFNDSNLVLGQGAAILRPSGLLMLTNSSQFVIGHAFHPNAQQMFDKTSESVSNVSSFNTTFVFAIVPSDSGPPAGYGFAFVIAPSTQFPNAESGHYLGLFNSSNNGNNSNHIFSIEFDTVEGIDEPESSKGSHVGINKNGVRSIASETAEYTQVSNAKKVLFLDSGDLIQAWIEYDHFSEVVNVTIAPIDVEKPTEPLISHKISLSSVLEENMFVGFSASTGKETSFHYITGWSFAINGPAPPLNLSLLPIPLPIPPKPEIRLHPPAAFNPLVTILVPIFSVMFLMGILFLAQKNITRGP